MSDDPVFLVGSERSGTTLLRLMLDHHPEIAFEKDAQWKTKLSARDVALVEARTARLMESRGYLPSGYPLPRVGLLKHELLRSSARWRRFRTRLDTFGPGPVTLEVLCRRLGLRPLARHAQTRINAVEQSLVDQERSGERASSANIAPIGRPSV